MMIRGRCLMGLLLAMLLVAMPLGAQDDVDIVEQNIDIARSLFMATWGGENLDDPNNLSNYLAIGFEYHYPNSDAVSILPLDFVQGYWTLFHENMSESEVTIDHVLAYEDIVAIHYTFRGILNGTVRGGCNGCIVEGTDEEVAWDGIDLYHMEDGKVVEMWQYWDNEFYARAAYNLED